MLSSNELVLTADGSHSLRSRRFGVDYHSVHGAIQESRHVFITSGLQSLLATGTTEVTILEMGFGSGLNALLVRQIAEVRPDVRFTYFTYDQFPLTPTEVAGLNYPAQLGVPAKWLFDLHDCGWETPVVITPNFTLHKRQADYLTDDRRPYAPDSADLIFYDAFAPTSQPELWTPAAMVVNWEALKINGTLVTYCAKGQFKRNLKAVGFLVDGLPGPPGKREMVAASKQ